MASAAASSSSSSKDLAYTSAADIDRIYATAKERFTESAEKGIEWRRRTLLALRHMLKENSPALRAAMKVDMNRCAFEAEMFEMNAVITQIDDILHNLSSWTEDESVPTIVALVTASSRIHRQPKGAVLVIGAWNYPVQLTIGPIVDVVAAGNTVVLKPSELSPRTAVLLGELIPRYVDDQTVQVVQGAITETQKLLDKRWDHIVYTGSSRVARVVMEKAAKHLTPVTLELGGKCPVIVDETANLEVMARRVCAARFANAGQTCLACDYVLAVDSMYDRVVDAIKRTVRTFYGEDPSKSPDFARVVHERHFEYVQGLLEDACSKGAHVVVGGIARREDRYFPPTVVVDVPDSADLARSEVFGPILSIKRVKSVADAVAIINRNEKPLALYVFSDSTETIGYVTKHTLSGQLVINDALLHRGVTGLPFGGVGESGMGSYSARNGFMEFSHHRAVFHQSSSTLLDLPVRYPPYTESNASVIRFLAGMRMPNLGGVSIGAALGVGILIAWMTGYLTPERLTAIVEAFKP